MRRHGRALFTARAALAGGGAVVVRVRPRVELQEKQDQIQGIVREYDQLSADKSSVRRLYMLFLLLDRAVHSVRGHLDRPGSVAADQRADFGAAGGRRRRCVKAT